MVEFHFQLAQWCIKNDQVMSYSKPYKPGAGPIAR
jgi:hypothetical protein